MQVKCVICDIVESIEENSPEAKKLRNRRIHMYLCQNCHQRITDKTNKRHNSGNFKLYAPKNHEDDFI